MKILKYIWIFLREFFYGIIGYDPETGGSSTSYIRIRKGNNNTNEIVYTIEGNKIYYGIGERADVAYNIDGKYIREGWDPTGTILYNIDGPYVIEGMSCFGKKVAYIDGKYIREGFDPTGYVIYNID